MEIQTDRLFSFSFNAIFSSLAETRQTIPRITRRKKIHPCDDNTELIQERKNRKGKNGRENTK